MTSSKQKQNIILKFKKTMRTDIPLNNDSQTKFLTALISLMSFLFVMSCAGSIILHQTAERWSTSLQNKISIEISSEQSDGIALNNREIKKEAYKIKKALENYKNVKTIKILQEEEIRDLISPWIGKNLELDGIPLPGIIAIELTTANLEIIKDLDQKIKQTSKYATLETYEDWLNDFLSFLNFLKTVALIIACMILAITVIALISAMHIRLALNKEDVKLLHLMGASDAYIARQFIPHNFFITLKGSVIGTLCAIFFTIILSNLSSAPMIPKVDLSILWYCILLLSPIFLGMISITVSYIVLLRTLSKMP